MFLKPFGLSENFSNFAPLLPLFTQKVYFYLFINLNFLQNG